MVRLIVAVFAAAVVAPASAQISPALLIADCDRLAADDLDPVRPTGIPGMPLGNIDGKAAVPACAAAAKAEPNNPRIIYQLARALEAAKVLPAEDLQLAREGYDRAHQASYTPASTALAVMLYEGVGGKRDHAQARKLFETAAKAGHPGAMRQLGTMQARGEGGRQDSAQAQRWLQQALSELEKLAAAGNPSAMRELAVIYEQGHGAPQDLAKGRHWRERWARTDCERYAASDFDPAKPASVQGIIPETIDAPAARAACDAAAKAAPGDGRVAFHLGRALEASKREAEARAAYERADQLGHPLAAGALAHLLHRGRGGPKDLERARALLEKAAAAGDPAAMRELGSMHRRGEGVPKDGSQARQWFRQARAQAEKLVANGNTEAMMLLAALQQNGRGGPKDPAAALELRLRAAKAGHAGAAFALAHAAQESKELAAAREWYEQAAVGNHHKAMAPLGVMYDKGEGGPRDLDAAERWLARAAAAGDSAGKKVLERLRKAAQR